MFGAHPLAYWLISAVPVVAAGWPMVAVVVTVVRDARVDRRDDATT